MSFPKHSFDTIAAYFDDYARELKRALETVSREQLSAAAEILSAAASRDAHIYACGNGGSAAISNHLVCDHTKGVSADTVLRQRVQSLSATVELLSAVANDVEYAEVFAYQLRLFGRPGDVLITISSSGDSENVVRAIQVGRESGIATISLTGFGGGRSAKLADVNLHVDADNYGVVEDVHQSVMHVLAQYLRMANMPAELVESRKF